MSIGDGATVGQGVLGAEGLLLTGDFVGVGDGKMEGPEGLKDGAPVGLFVGANVGFDGACVWGFFVGYGLGIRLGFFVNVGRHVNVGLGVRNVGDRVIIGTGVGRDDGAKVINCTTSFVVAFPVEIFVETVVVVSSEDPQVVDRNPQSSNAMNMFMAPLLFDLLMMLLY